MTGLEVPDYEASLPVANDGSISVVVHAVNGDLNLRRRQTASVQRCPVKNSGRRLAIGWDTPQMNS
jgi:hypothetical protein